MVNRKVIAAVGVAVFAFALIGQRRRRVRRLGREAASFAEGEKVNKRAHCVADEALPVEVDPEKLPPGWYAAPPIYFPAKNQAVISLVTPQCHRELEEVAAQHENSVRVPGSNASKGAKAAEGDPPNGTSGKGSQAAKQVAFILCDGPNMDLFARVTSGDSAAVREVICDLVLTHPLFHSFVAGRHVTVTEVPVKSDADESAECAAKRRPAFSHLVSVETDPAEPVALLVGLQSPYASIAVLMGFLNHGAGPKADEEAAVATTDPLEASEEAPVETTLQDALEAVCAAAYTVPYTAAHHPLANHASGRFAFPGTPIGAHQGQYRVTMIDGDRTIVLGAPSDVVVRSQRNAGETTMGDVNFTCFSEAAGEYVTCVLTAAMMHTIASSEPCSLALACPSALETASPGQRELLELINVVSVQHSQDRLSTQGQVTVVYHHPPLRAFFSVNEETGVVHDPILTDVPQVFYFPLGNTADGPCMTVQEFPRFPDTWEMVLKDDDELVHNVRFHFTEWDKERVECSVMELSGLKCVQFTETKDGVRCRSYVVPRRNTILTVRCESSEEAFDKNLPLLQTFLDTLHVDA